MDYSTFQQQRKSSENSIKILHSMKSHKTAKLEELLEDPEEDIYVGDKSEESNDSNGDDVTEGANSTANMVSMKDIGYNLESCNCLVCEKETPFWLLTRNPTWSSIMRVVFFALMRVYPDKKYFSLRTEVYSYVIDHWDHLCSSKKRSENWKKQLQDTLSHNKKLFVSGFEQYKQNGFWGLKQCLDPWDITDTDCTEEGNPLNSGGKCERKMCTEYKAVKDDILQTLIRLEGSVVGLREQVQLEVPNLTPSFGVCGNVVELEGRLKSVWAQADHELQLVSEEMRSIYEESNSEVDMISCDAHHLLETHAKDFDMY